MRDNQNSRAAVAEPQPPSTEPAGRPLRAGLPWLGGVLLAIYAALIWLDLPAPAGMKYGPPPTGAGQVAAHWWDKTQGLRGWSLFPEGWAWALLNPAPLPYWLLLIGLGLLGGAGLWAWERRRTRPGTRQIVGALVALVVLGYALQLAALWLKQPAWLPQPNANQLLYNRIVDRSFTGFFNTAIRSDDPTLFFARYADAIARTDEHRLCGHCRTHPPGPILFYWLPLEALRALPTAAQDRVAGALIGLTQITPATTQTTDTGQATGDVFTPAQNIVAILAGHVILLGAALVVVPLYGSARRLAGPRHALALAALGLTLPGLLLMSPEFDQFYGTMTAALLYLALRGLSSPQRAGRWGFGTGLALAGCLYWSFGLWVLGGLLAALAVAAAAGALGARRPPDYAEAGPLPWRAAGLWLAGLLAGTALPWLLLWGIGNFDLPRVLAITSQVHLQGITARRPYGPWLVFDLVDFLQSTGLPLVTCTLLTLGWFTARWNLYGLLFWGSLLALDVAGVARAEVGRLWIFLMPLALLGVYHAAGRGRLRAPQIAALLAAQFVVCVLIAGRWLTP